MHRRGFFSVVAHRDDASKVLVRARCERDIRALDDLLPGAVPAYTPDADYEWRLECTKDQWSQAVAKMATEIDYPNFKASVNDKAHRFVVLTGGEPLLQVDDALVDALHAQDFKIAVETNGTLAAPGGIDWICVSPKAGAPWVQRQGQELKVVWPQAGFSADELQAMQELAFEYHHLQPLDDVFRTRNTAACIAICLAQPVWKLSLQTHKMTGIR
jgi:organic radical activating enzyme